MEKTTMLVSAIAESMKAIKACKPNNNWKVRNHFLKIVELLKATPEGADYYDEIQYELFHLAELSGFEEGVLDTRDLKYLIAMDESTNEERIYNLFILWNDKINPSY